MSNTPRARAGALIAAVAAVYVLATHGLHGSAQTAPASLPVPFPGFTTSANAEGKAEITSVAQGAAATATDLLPHDVITAADGVDVTQAQLESLLKAMPVGGSVVIDYVRPPLNVPMQRLLLNAPRLPALAGRPGWIVGRCITPTGAPLKNATVRLTGMVHRALGVTTPQGPQLTDDTYINIPVSADGRYEKQLEDGWYATSAWETVTFEGKTYNLPLTGIGRQDAKFLAGHRDSRSGIVQDFCCDTREGSITISDILPDRPTALGAPGSQVVLSLTPQQLVLDGSTLQGYRVAWPLPGLGHVIGTHTAKGIPLGRYTMTVSVVEPGGATHVAMLFGGAAGVDWVPSASVLFPLEGTPGPGMALGISVDPTRSQ